MPEKRVEIIIMGKVHGVSYRYYTCQKAQELNLQGCVSNENDGSVKIIVEGEKEKIDQFIEWCKTGPEHAIVENIKINWQNPTGEFNDFEIKQ